MTSFLGIDLLVDKGVLLPRLETELLARTALRLLTGPAAAPGGGEFGPVVIDMCCGAGNLACALGCHVPGARIFATDLMPACVALAQENVRRLGLANRVEVRCGDLFAPLADLLPAGTFGAGPTDAPVDSLADLPADLIVCNPPYISTGRLLNERAELLLHEPREAFDGGPYGIAIHQRVIRAAPPFLRPGGWLLFEIGSGQERQVRLLFDRSRSYRDVEEVRDASGSVRVMLARTPLPASQVIGRFDSNLCGPG